MSTTEPSTGDKCPEQADMSAIDVFHYKEDCRNFEDFGRDNGFRYWYASDLGKCLEYGDYNSFRKGALNRAMAACLSLNIPIDENFVSEKRAVDGREIQDFKLSRFACYLTAMNGDTKKPKVAQAQAYFAAMAESFRQYLADANEMERLAIRDEITGREKSLAGAASMAGVSEYGLFQNAGYRGMYNMNLSELKRFKGMADPSKCLLDFMGRPELAANFFRITQTEEKIKNEAIRGQTPCERAAFVVGRTVRDTMRQLSNTTPESLPLEANIKDTKKKLKQAGKGFKKLDVKEKKGLPE